MYICYNGKKNKGDHIELFKSHSAEILIERKYGYKLFFHFKIIINVLEQVNFWGTQPQKVTLCVTY